MSSTKNPPLIDVRVIPHPERHSRVFGVLTMLAPGDLLHVVSDHDPRPLRYQIEARYPDQFHWQYLTQGPDVWRAEIQRYKNAGCNCSCSQ